MISKLVAIRTPRLSQIEDLGHGYYRVRKDVRKVEMELQVIRSTVKRIEPGERIGQARASWLKLRGVEVEEQPDPWLLTDP